ncbi:hypothetical protein H8959_001434 [Pygathrix nigripes]
MMCFGKQSWKTQEVVLEDNDTDVDDTVKAEEVRENKGRSRERAKARQEEPWRAGEPGQGCLRPESRPCQPSAVGEDVQLTQTSGLCGRSGFVFSTGPASREGLCGHSGVVLSPGPASPVGLWTQRSRAHPGPASQVGLWTQRSRAQPWSCLPSGAVDAAESCSALVLPPEWGCVDAVDSCLALVLPPERGCVDAAESCSALVLVHSCTWTGGIAAVNRDSHLHL